MEHPSWNEGNAHLYYIITKDPKERQKLIAFLAQRGIDARPHYVPLHESPMGKRFGTFHGKISVPRNPGGFFASPCMKG